MEVIFDCFFNDVINEFERASLLVQYKRKAVVDHINALIEGCIKGQNCDPQEACRHVVISAIRFHEKHKNNNGTICMMGKYHNVLYVAMKLCFDWKLKDSATVACVLDNIYSCEKTFERLLVGAVFGTKAPYFIAGWKSDFQDQVLYKVINVWHENIGCHFSGQDENVRALVYFLDHAGTAGIEYTLPSDTEPTRFIDIPMESCGNMSPVKIVIQTGAPDTLLILLRFGAVLSEDARMSGLLPLLDRLTDFKRVYPFHLVSCLKIILRTIISVRVYPEDYIYTLGSNIERDHFLTKYPYFIEDKLVPESRCGIKPPELKHLSRCAIRYRLWENYQLPNGIWKLPVPSCLHRYLDLLED